MESYGLPTSESIQRPVPVHPKQPESSKATAVCKRLAAANPSSGAKYFPIKRRDSDSDGQTETDGEHDIDFKEKLKRFIAESKKRSTTTH
jgi:hypothetical protein